MGNLFGHCIGTPPRVHSSPAIDGERESTPAPVATAPTLSQPLLPPSVWFLTHEETTNSRGGVCRSDLALYSTGDHVDTYSSSDAYFLRLLRDMDTADVTSIWIAGWSLNHTVPLDPTSTDASNTTLQAIIERAVKERGVHVRALVWANLFMRAECLATRDWMNALGAASPTNGSALMLFDNRLPHRVSSHHQKCVVVQRANGACVAFMGGLDITVDRWDTLTHDQASLRRARGWTAEFDGWIDASVRLEGAAARDVAATFAARWNSSVKPAHCWKDELLDFENPTMFEPIPAPALPPTITEPVTAAIPTSTLSVQIVRTFSPVRAAKMYADMAPSGELSLLQSRVKAIGLAKNWIFIQDQYFFFMPQLMTALHTTLTSQPTLRVVVVVQNPSITMQSKIAGYEKLLFNMAQPLRTAFGTRVQIYTTKPARNLYIHTKLLMIDDAFLSISSANWNRRSMTSDSELGANMVDVELVDTPDAVRVGKRVRAFQLEKLEELTGHSVDALQKLTIAGRCTLLAEAAKETATIVQPLEMEKRWEFLIFNDEYVLHVVDPDDVNHGEHAGSSSDDD